MNRAVGDDALVAAARAAREDAYAPYSGFKVGAAVVCKDGRVFTGVNVESLSYGLTCCAERVAIFKAVSEGSRSFEAIAVVAGDDGIAYPCGACRQVMNEFAPAMRVIVEDLKGHRVATTLAALFPDPFGPRGDVRQAGRPG
jgi:cytidine deaminase